MSTLHITDLNTVNTANLFDEILIKKNVNNYDLMYKQTLSAFSDVFLPITKLMDLYNLLSCFEPDIKSLIATRCTKETIDTKYESLQYVSKEDANYYRSILLTRDKLCNILENQYITGLTLSTDITNYNNYVQVTIASMLAQIGSIAAISRFGESNSSTLEDSLDTVATAIDGIELTVPES